MMYRSAFIVSAVLLYTVFVGGVISLYHYNYIAGDTFRENGSAARSLTAATDSYPILIQQAIQKNSINQKKFESVSSRLFFPLLVAEYYQK